MAAITALNAGELSPLLRGRTDFAKYAHGADLLENFLPTVQGPLRRRIGTAYMGEAAFAHRNCLLIPFEANSGAVFMLEVGDRVMRFWTRTTYGGDPVIFFTDGSWGTLGAWNAAGSVGPPYPVGPVVTLPTPWAASDLVNADGSAALHFVQSNDVMWLVHPRTFPVKLSRTATHTFSWAYMGADVPVPIPFKDQNTDEAITVLASAYFGGGVTLTATAPIFTPELVTRYFYLEQPAADAVAPWEPGKLTAPGQWVRSDGKNYVCTGSANRVTGTVKPTHSSGSKTDGSGVVAAGLPFAGTTIGAVWKYADDGYGIVAITGISPDGLEAAGVITKALPATCTTTPSHRWARPAWNDVDGYPNAVAFFRERLCFARGQTVWTSVAGDYENFQAVDAGLVTADMAVTATVASARNDRILWLTAGADLLAGTASGAHAIGESTTSEPFGPTNIKSKPVAGQVGVRGAMPVQIGEATLFIDRSGARLRELVYDSQIDGYRSDDKTVLAEHILRPAGVAQMAFQRNPDSILWCALSDGSLRGFTYNREQDVSGWHRHTLGGQLSGAPPKVRAIACIPSPDGTADDVWMVVDRSIGGIARSTVEVMGPTGFTGHPAYYHDIPGAREAAYLDCFTRETVSPYLNGETVAALWDGRYIPPFVALNGIPETPELPPLGFFDYGAVIMGLPYSSRFRSMPLVQPTSAAKRIAGLVIRIYRSLNVLFGSPHGELERHEFRVGDGIADEPLALVTDDLVLAFPASHEQAPQVAVETDQPYPLTILALVPTEKA
jgi:hypothetical protein